MKRERRSKKGERERVNKRQRQTERERESKRETDRERERGREGEREKEYLKWDAFHLVYFLWSNGRRSAVEDSDGSVLHHNQRTHTPHEIHVILCFE
jgi:hypothetical protein